MEIEGKKLLEGVDLSKYAPGTAIYVNFGSVNPQFDLGFIDRFYIMGQILFALKKCGIKWSIGRYSNIRATRLYTNMGGKIIKETTFER